MQNRLVKVRKRDRIIVCLWAVIVNQPFDQIASGQLVKIGYQVNS